MSVLGEAEVAVETATGTGWLHIALRMAPWISIVVLIGALGATRAKLAEVRLTDRANLAQARQHDAEAIAANADRRSAALATYAAQIGAHAPLIVHSTETVTRYAETPAGRAPCLDADRVHGLDTLDASLGVVDTAGSGQSALHSDAGAPAAGR